MDNIHPKAALLLGYVDKKLTLEELAQAELLLANDPEAVAFVETLNKSKLPYKESFEFLLEGENSSATVIPFQRKQSSWQWPVSIASSLILGLAIGYGMFSISSPVNSKIPNWITEVVNYQMLYVRDTVIHTPSISKSQKAVLRDRLAKALNIDLHIPDLSKQQLTFKRGQILNIGGKPLIQLVYLPDNDLPVALCIIRNDAADSLPKAGESRGESFIEWSKNGLSYVIIGKVDKKIIKAASLAAITQISS